MNTICIMCPMGCPLEIVEKDGQVIVSGNTCKRGKDYGVAEYTRPVRTLTSLVKREGGGVASVKTSAPFDKSRLLDAAEELKKFVAPKDCKIGDVIVKDLLGLGTDVVVTGNLGE